MIKNKIVKYGTRKLSIGLCSIMLGAMLIVQPMASMNKSYAITQEEVDKIKIEKVEVEDIDNLSADDREDIENNVKKALNKVSIAYNKIEVSPEGVVTITFKDNTTHTYKKEDVAIQKEYAKFIKPIIPGKTKVKNKTELTEEEKTIVKNKIIEANKNNFPINTIVTIEKNGKAIITYKDSSKTEIKGELLVQEEDITGTDADKITPILPEDKVPVADKTKVDEDEITSIIYFIEETNANNFPKGTTVKVENGKVVITYPDKSVDTINVVDLVVETIGAKYKNLKNVKITPVVVKDKANLTEEEKEKAKQEIQKHIKDEAEYSVDKFGTVFVKFKDGTKCTVFGYRFIVEEDNYTKQKRIIDNELKNNYKKLLVRDKNNLTEQEKEKLRASLFLTDQVKNVEVKNNGDSTIILKTGEKLEYKGELLVEEMEKSPENMADKVNLVIKSKVKVKDKNNLTRTEKALVRQIFNNINYTKLVIEDDGKAIVTFADNSVMVVEGHKLVEEIVKNNSNTDNKDNKTNNVNNKTNKKNKDSLAKTGIANNSSVVIPLVSSMLGTVAFIVNKKRKNK